MLSQKVTFFKVWITLLIRSMSEPLPINSMYISVTVRYCACWHSWKPSTSRLILLLALDDVVDLLAIVQITESNATRRSAFTLELQSPMEGNPSSEVLAIKSRINVLPSRFLRVDKVGKTELFSHPFKVFWRNLSHSCRESLIDVTYSGGVIWHKSSGLRKISWVFAESLPSFSAANQNVEGGALKESFTMI